MRHPPTLLWWLWLAGTVSLVAASVTSRPKSDAGQAAAQLFPGHTLLQLTASTTSRLQASLQQAFARGSGPGGGAAAAVLVVLAGGPLLVDQPLRLRRGQALALATPAALQAAAAEAAGDDGGGDDRSQQRGPAVPASGLLVVQCKGSKGGSFITADSGAADLQLLGLSVQACAGSAVVMAAGGRLLVQDSVLLANNHRQKVTSGGAISAVDVAKVVLRGVRCEANYATVSGGCLSSKRAKALLVSHSSFLRNWKDDPDFGGGGGAIAAERAAAINVTHCSFAGNTGIGIGSVGGGLWASNSGDVLVAHSSFVNNSAHLEGGGIQAGDVASLTIRSCSFVKNGPLPPPPGTDDKDLDQGGAPEVQHTSNGAAVNCVGNKITNFNPINVTITDSSFVDNIAEAGGAVAANQWGRDTGRLEVVNCNLTGNNGTMEAGGIYYNENYFSIVRITSTTFARNSGPYGGGVSAYDSDVLLTNCTFVDNSADSDGGAIQVQTNMAAGSNNSLTIRGCLFENNANGGLGGAVAVDAQGLVMEDSNVTGSKALSGGAISVINAQSMVLRRLRLSHNEATQDYGGAVYVSSVDSAVLEDLLVERNLAVKGGGIWLQLTNNAKLERLTLSHNSASSAAGAIGVVFAGQVLLRDSLLEHNSAPVAGGLAADGSSIDLRNVTLSANAAGDGALLELGDEEQPEVSSSGIQEFQSLIYTVGTAGAALLQRSSVTADGCSLRGNTAQADGGGLVVQQPASLALADCAFEGNVALNGEGGGLVVRGVGQQAANASLQGCSFAGNAARGRSGGAVLLDSGLGPIQWSCQGCSFDGNSAAQDGGAVAAIGATRVDCGGCRSTNNSALQRGGWLACSGCTSVGLSDGSSASNSAAIGGAESCDGCGAFRTHGSQYQQNAASAGGAVAVLATPDVRLERCDLQDNTAAAVATAVAVAVPAGDGSSGRLQAGSALPAAWQLMYGAGALAASAVACRGGGAGGGVCIGGAYAAAVVNSSFRNNQGDTGGALAASVDCSGEAGGSRDAAGRACRVDLVNLTAQGNQAAQAGGAWYTKTPDNVSMAASAGQAATGSGSDDGDAEQQRLLQQLADSNTVAAAGYGPGAATYPVSLALMPNAPSLGNSSSGSRGAAATARRRLLLAADQQQQPAVAGGRRLLSNFITQMAQLTTGNTQNKVLSALDATDATLPPVCPPLGATILSDQAAAVDAGQPFSLLVNILDAFGSRVSSGPGSDWPVALQQQQQPGGSGGAAVGLTGDARGSLQGGAVLLDNLTVTSPPGSEIWVEMAAAAGQPGDISRPMPPSRIRVSVRPCLPGQAAAPSNDGSSTTCLTCAAPSFSFSSRADTSGREVCQGCPFGGLCIGGMVIPSQGCYQPHPRSTSIHVCPHVAACSRSNTSMLDLQMLQCDNRRFISSAQVDPRPYGLLQCSRGYAGPFCSCCYRPGRNTWLQRGWQQQQQQQQRAAPGPALPLLAASQGIALLTERPEFDPQAVYGRSSGRCSSCPHIALAWLGFLAARLLDCAFIALLALLWVGLGWLSQSGAAAALQVLKEEKRRDLTMRSNILGPRLSKTLSKTLGISLPGSKSSLVGSPKHPANQQQQQQHSGSQVQPLGPGSGQQQGSVTRLQAGVPSSGKGMMWVQPAAAAGGGGSAPGSAASLSAGSVLGLGRIPTYLKSSVSGPSSSGSAAVYAAVHGGTAAAAAAGGGLDLQHSVAPSSDGSADPLPQPSQPQQQQQLVPSPRRSSEASPPAAAGGAVPGRPMLLGVPLTVIESVEDSSVQQGWSQQLASMAGGNLQAHSSAPAAAGGDYGATAARGPSAVSAGPGSPVSANSASSSSGLLGSIFARVQHFGGRGGSHAGLMAVSSGQSQVGSLKHTNSHLQRYRQGSRSILSTTGSSSSSSSIAGGPASSGVLSRVGSGFYQMYHPVSMRWSSALNLVNARPAAAAAATGKAAAGSPGGAGDLDAGGEEPGVSPDAQASIEECAALLLMAVKHLACLAQVVLDTAQIAAVVLSQDLLWRLPDWAAAGLTGLIITQASSWQWVPFDCLLPGWSPASGAAVQAVVVMLLPFIYVSVLLPLLLLARNAASRHSRRSLKQQQSPVPSALQANSSLASLGSFLLHQYSSTISSIRMLHSTGSGTATAAGPSPFVAAAAAASAGSVGAAASQGSTTSSLTLAVSGAAAAAPGAAVGSSSGLLLAPSLTGGVSIITAAMPEDNAVLPDADDLKNGPFLVHGTDHDTECPDQVPASASSGSGLGPFGQHQQQKQQQHSWTADKQQHEHQQQKPGGGSRRKRWAARCWPFQRSTWVLAAALAIAATSYCYAFTASAVVSAFNCMHLAGRPSVPGEVSLPASHWVPDMQLQCWRGGHIAVAVIAVMVGVPLLLGYWLLLLVLAWPPVAAATAGAAAAAAAAGGNGGSNQQQQQAQPQPQHTQQMVPQQMVPQQMVPQQMVAQQMVAQQMVAQQPQQPPPQQQQQQMATQQLGPTGSFRPRQSLGLVETESGLVPAASLMQPAASVTQQLYQRQPLQQWQQQQHHQQQQFYQPAAWNAGTASASGSGDASWSSLLRSPRLLLRRALAALLALPRQLLGPPVRMCQVYTRRVGVSGSACAGLDVWNVEWRWWWLLVRELVKFVIIASATVMSMRGPRVQAMLVLLLVVAAAASSWHAQPGCSTTMDRLMFVGHLWLQALALLVLLLTVQWLDETAFGGVLLALLLLLALQVCVMLVGLAVRCLQAARMSRKLHPHATAAA